MEQDFTSEFWLSYQRFSQLHHFAKPNDAQALELMNEAARRVMQEFKGHITLAFGESDEYRYVMLSS